MDGTADDRYFEWLYSQVGAARNRNPARSYWDLCKELYKKEFLWFIPNDDNRLEDGRELRLEFLAEQGNDPPDQEWLSLGCSMLEMLVALSRRVAFEASESPVEWFWRLLENIGLSTYSDALFNGEAVREISDALDRVIHRQYAYTGEGGLFPLSNPRKDQREVELWYQMAAYLLEVAPV